MIGPIDHTYYWTRDMDAAVTFYRDVVGWPLLRREGDGWAEFDAGPIRFALHGTDNATVPAAGTVDAVVPAGGTVVLRVVDLQEARWTLEQRGAVFDAFIGQVEGFARFATFRDPDGNPVQLIEYGS